MSLCDIIVWIWSKYNWYSVGTVDTIATAQSTHPCISSCLWVKKQILIKQKKHSRKYITYIYMHYGLTVATPVYYLFTAEFHELLAYIIFILIGPGKFEWNFRYVIYNQILVTDGCGISCEIALLWMSLDFTNYQSTLVQVMAWCHQATSHYLSQCWPRSLSPYGITGPEWVNSLYLGRCTRKPYFIKI